jgi:hypothetical protein
VEITVDQGAVPVARMLNGLHLQHQAKAYHRLANAVTAHVEAVYGGVIGRKCRGEYLEGEAYRLYCKGTSLKRALMEARAMRSHHSRNARIHELMTKHQIPEPAQVWEERPAAEWTNAKPATVRGSQVSLF